MHHPRSAQNTGTEKKTPSTPKKTFSAPMETLSTPEKALGAPKYSPPATTQDDPPLIAEEPTSDCPGLANSILGNLPGELRLAIMQLQIQRLRKVSIVPKALITPSATSAEHSLVYTTSSALAKTCYDLHTRYANELRSQVLSRKIPSLKLHVLDFDFAPFTHELFPAFAASHREYFNARPGAITIHLRLTESFFTRAEGEAGKLAWLAKRDGPDSGLKQWLEWREAEESAGRKVSVAYKVERNKKTEGEEDVEALRLFLLLIDPCSDEVGEVGDFMGAMVKHFKAVQKTKSQAQMGMVR